MNDFLHLQDNPQAFQAIKKPIPVGVQFATSSGTLETLEGSVRYQTGDALLTGLEGERWPIGISRFIQTYEPVAPLVFGDDGLYKKKLIPVWAYRADHAMEFSLSDSRGILQAKLGDVIIEYSPNDHAVVNGSIFEKTYEIL